MAKKTPYPKLAVYVGQRLHTELKLLAATERRSLSDLSEDLLRRQLKMIRAHATKRADDEEGSG